MAAGELIRYALNMKTIKLNDGDVFQIPIDENNCAFGQIIYANPKLFPIYIVVFQPEFKLGQDYHLETICSSEIALVGGSMGARIDHGFWKIVGNKKPDLSRIPRAKFKMNAKGKALIIDFDGKVLRHAKPDDMEKYLNVWSLSPMAFEKAIKAIHGRADWLPAFDPMVLENAIKQSV